MLQKTASRAERRLFTVSSIPRVFTDSFQRETNGKESLFEHSTPLPLSPDNRFCVEQTNSHEYTPQEYNPLHDA